MKSLEFDQDWTAYAMTVAKQAGCFLKKGMETSCKVNYQDAHDVKLQVDVDSENLIREELNKLTDFPIIGEEIGGDADLVNRQEPFWVVDPLDGSYNYLRGQSSCCVSIGLMCGLDFLYGVIYDFNRDELFSGGPSQGLYINGEKVDLGWADSIEKACLATGFPVGRDYSAHALESFMKEVQRFKKIRMIGSAALALANVAARRMDAYYEESIRLWDVAAGAALVLGAGGYVRADPPSNGKSLAYNFWAVSQKEWIV